jgi:peptidoglycan-associated lipoprotein
MNAITLALAFSVFLGGCASGIQLDAPPVEDKTPSLLSGKPQQSGGTTTGTGGIAGTGVDRATGSTIAGASTATTQPQVTEVSAQDSLKVGDAPANVTKVLYFDLDSFQIRPEFMPVLDAHARWLKANRNRRAAIEGHTDATGSNEYNLALGQRRADSVARALTLMGVSEAQIESVSFGEEKPSDPASTDEALAKNRRVELFYR